MPDILQDAIAGISEAIHGPQQPGDPHVVADAAPDHQVVMEAG